ncbi:MAG: CvpA family protein [Eubacteriales bacterium]
MSILDWAVIIIILYATLTGVYRGFIHSACSLGAFFLSWGSAALFSPMLSARFVKGKGVFDFVYNYAEGSEQLTHFEDTKLLVENLSADKIKELVTESNLPAPFSSLMTSNITHGVFSDQGVTTLGEYYNLTIANVCVNILSFVVVFFIARAILAFAINAANYTFKFPVLRMLDSTIGGVFGFLSGLFTTYAVFILTPLVLIIQPIQQIYDIIYGSAFADFFYSSNFLLNFIRGTI